ncbi:hypothetical protein [Flavobacterium nitrogenifigens]|uniref:Uncharacterized protein n=1 Tax=Flavobacterium nitrogenifigens TaxID=1617283 RepID=A0A521AE99_9FLAO|nr:hypothetical protein [Flavobacterium nitrogenifigens]KAF2331463.1 hypothetical protein DM397_12050 [Flavobacterium nitrogenifigens]SMO33108.1 hypothetical protein SAMN06265220_10157 [Flavobacterium nitrogenifigens]
MQQVVTEIYIAPFSGSTDYVKLDLFNNESINLKYTQKDLTDLSKVFAPYSLSFTIPATPKNRQALLFFGDTDVLKANITGSFPCKIYTDGNLNLTGNFNVEEAKYDNNGITSIQGSFETDFKSLKERIGEDLISDLATVLTGSTSLQFTPTVARDSIHAKQLLYKELDYVNSGTTSANDIVINYITPLASNNRVWSYSQVEDVTDNIAYSAMYSGATLMPIETTELKPAVSYRALVEMMFKKYGLQVNMPLRNDKMFNEMYVWVNGAASEEKLSDNNVINFSNQFNTIYCQLLIFDAMNQGVQLPATPEIIPFFGTDVPPGFLIGSDPFKYHVSNSLKNGFGTIKINIGDKATSSMPDIFTLQRTTKYIRFSVQLTNLVLQTTSGKINISLRRPNGTKAPADCEEILNASVDMVTGNNNIFVDIPDTLFDNYTEGYELYPSIEFYLLFKADLASWEVTNIYTQYGYASADGGWLQGYNTIAQRCFSDGSEKFKASGGIDFVQSLPKMKVVDFFQSFLKTFNLSIYNPIVNTNQLQILSVEDVNEEHKIYAKKEVDYTAYVNASTYTKSVQDKYNKYNFKHATSKYKSNVDYVAGNTAGLEYGQINQENNSGKANEYSVVTNYTIIPPRGVLNTNLQTYYGFSNEAADEQNRYKPINTELVLFVNNNLTYLSNGVELGFLLADTNIVPINSYMLMLPWFANTKQSLGFSVLIDDVSGDSANKEKTESLYQRYYSAQTTRLLNVNSLSHKFDLYLPSSEIYVNPTRGNEPPTGFRLQNDIIIGETRFSVLDANIDITTGKAKLNLLNYLTADNTGKGVLPTPNMYSPDGYDSTQYQIQ